MKMTRPIVATCLLVACLVTACGGGGSSSTTPTPTPTPVVTLKDTSYAIAAANALSGMTNWNASPFLSDGAVMRVARSMMDLDGDGIADAVVAYGKFLESSASVPMAIYKGAKNGTFTDVTATMIDGTVPKLNHARKVIAGDYNGDGVNDVFVCAHGYDASPFPGTTNAMLLSGGGKLKPVTDAWVQTVGFHHGCASADIDEDGDLDLFVADQKGGSYFLINDGKGVFKLDRARVPAAIGNPSLPLFTVEMFDLDGDGHVDLLVGGDETYLPTYAYWGDGSGTFSDQRRATIPAVAGWQNPLVFASNDIDGDGKRELTVARTPGGVNFYKGYLAQVLKLAGRTFTDVTSTTAVATNASAPTVIYSTYAAAPSWLEWIWWVDRDGDGKPDLVGSDGSQVSGSYWAKNLGGSFAAWIKL